jgi:hypothetical protein
VLTNLEKLIGFEEVFSWEKLVVLKELVGWEELIHFQLAMEHA